MITPKEVIGIQKNTIDAQVKKLEEDIDKKLLLFYKEGIKEELVKK